MHSDSERKRKRLVSAAEGYLMLDMPREALRELEGVSPEEAGHFDVVYLRGEVYRALGQHEAALREFEKARAEKPKQIGLMMAMAWCYKRTDQLPRAIEITREACQHAPREAVLPYNLACYLTLAGLRDEALNWLERALRMDADLRKLIPDETDFDTLRDDPDFQRVIAPAPTEA